MLRNKMDFALCLAEDALQRHFDAQGDICREFRKIREDCRDILSLPNTRRIYAKLVKMELNERAVKAVIQLLTEEKQKYLHLRYRRKKTLVAISLALHASVSQLNLWHHFILEQITRFMLYTLEQEDVFYPSRVVQMVRFQAETIRFFSKIDPEGTIVTKGWLMALISRHEQYRLLMINIRDAMRKEPKTRHECIIATRLAHPEESAKFIASSCHVHKGVVSHHLKEFGEDMNKYLM